MERYNLTYKYSKDNGLTWIDITEIVNSAQTSIVHNICTAGFKSATDTASFTIPAKDTPLKQNLINALLDGSIVLVKILENTETVLFTGYVNKDNISIRSYPLTATITIELKDVGSLNLDNKVNEYVYFKNYNITQIVHALLTKAGYTYDNSGLASGDEQTLEAFVIDKDNSDTYRNYIDTLLFEAGGYVLDFNTQGIASIVKLNWQATGDATIVDNPMDSEGVTTKTKILNVDGVSLSWASTKWSADNNQLLWQDSISRKLEDNYVVGEDVENQHYWPTDGELSPIYQEYNSELLDTDYLTNASRKQNEDLAIIVAEDIRAEIQATKNKEEFTSWTYPLIQEFIDDYELTENPIAYPKKAWYLLYNNSGETVNIQHFRLYGKVFYRDKKHTLKTKETKNPKEYESQYIYNETHANQFLQFYWHFMQTSRISVSWKEVGANHTLGDVVQVYHKGSLSYVKAIVAGITTTFIGKTKITSYSAVGVAAQIIPYPTLAITKLRGGTTAEAKGIDNIKVQYATSVTQVGTKTTYQDTIPTLDPLTAKYLWQRESVYYTDGTKDVFEDIISVYGDSGAKGDKGDAGDSIVAQYAYSTSATECTGDTLSWNNTDLYWGEEQGVWNWWTTQTLEEKKGYYIWLRTKIGNGDWVYTRLTGTQGKQGEQGEPAKVCTISCDKSAVLRDDRLTAFNVYTFSVSVQGYTYTTLKFTIAEGTGTETEKTLVDNKYAFTMPTLEAQAITARVYLDDVEMDSITLSVINQTEHGVYIGVFDSIPMPEEGTRFLKGDSYFNSSDNLIYTYGTHESVTAWHILSSYTQDELSFEERGSILAKGMSDALSSIEEGTVTKSDYAYFENLIVGIITANYISSQKIQLRDNGVISSSGVSTDVTEDIDDKGLLIPAGFRLENDGTLRASRFYLGQSSDDNKIIIDNKSIRCVDNNNNALWELLPDGSIIAYNLKAKGDITASSLSCNAITTQEPSGDNVFKSSETPFTQTLFSSSEAISWITDKYINNTIPVTESAFIASGWTYNGKTINHIALGIYAIGETIEGEGSNHRALVLGKQYYNSKTINAGNNKTILYRLLNNYSFPIWVYADLSLGGTMNNIVAKVYHSKDSDWLYNYNDKADAWVCLMPNQEIAVTANSWAWWGSQTAKAYIRVYPSYKNLCFAYNPVEVTSLRATTYTGSASAYTYNLFSITLPTGHPTSLMVVLNSKTAGSANLADTKYVSFKATGGATERWCTASFALDDNYTWVWHVSGIPSDATELQLYVTLKGTEATTDQETGETTTETVYYNLIISRLVYAICYNYETHNALIRYDDGSLQYLGTTKDYVQGTFSEKANVRYASSSIYNQIKTSLGVENGEYNITAEDTPVEIEGETKTLPTTSITIDGTTYTGMSKMIVTDTYVSFWGDTSSVIIYASGYNSTGAGSANDGGWYGDTYATIDATISVLNQPLGASTALLFPKANNTYDLGQKDCIYRTLYVNEVEGVTVKGAVFN